MAKLIHDILPTNTIRRCDDPTIVATCPQYSRGVEDRDHILRCPHREHEAWRVQFLVGLEKRYTELETAPDVEDGLLNGLYHWFQGEECRPEELDKATAAEPAQHELGWWKIFDGRMTTEWSIA